MIPPPRSIIRRETDKAIHTRRGVIYKDVKWKGSTEEYVEKVESSTTVYIGNLHEKTKEEEIYSLFSKCGTIKNVIMGLDRYKKVPCGFCFVNFETVSNAHDAVRYLNETRLCKTMIRVDKDQGFFEGRQYGRGKKGGQMRDDFDQQPAYQYHRRDQPQAQRGRFRDVSRRRSRGYYGGGRFRGGRGGGGYRPSKSRTLDLTQFQPKLDDRQTAQTDNKGKEQQQQQQQQQQKQQQQQPSNQLVSRPPSRNVTGRKRERGKMKDREDVEIEEWEKRRRKRRKRLEEKDSSSSGSESEEEGFRKRKRRNDSDDSDDDAEDDVL